MAARRRETAPPGPERLARGARLRLGLTQEALAERAGISPRSINDLERGGPHTPRRATVALLARALELKGDARDRLNVMVAEHRNRAYARLEQVRRQRSVTDHPRHNISRSLTRFIGREHELAELTALLQERPLLTLVGPGGVGKTRVAQELARRNDMRFTSGCRIVELAGLSDGALVPIAIARGIGLPESASEHMTDRLIAHIGQKHLLLVLDNCEHLVDACADVVAALLSHCPRLHILATSREPLAIGGETRWHVLPFAVPSTASLDDLQENAAVQLFLDRAASLDTIHLTRENASAVARICVSVDGVPLALELAAATTRLLSLGPDELNFIARLDPEHANLRAALRWAVSHEQTESALYAATALFQFWERRGHFQEGSGWLEAALARADASNVPAALRAAALNALAFLYWRGGAADRAEPVAREALAISRAAECAPELARSLLNLGMTAFLHHQFVRAEACLEESIGYAREAGRTTVHSVALAFLGRVLLMSTEAVPYRAVEVIRESLALARSAQSRYASAHALSTWGDLLWAQDNCAGAPRLEGRADGCFGSGGCTRCCWSPGAHGGCARALFTRGGSHVGVWRRGRAPLGNWHAVAPRRWC